jgi:hypothetical protein
MTDKASDSSQALGSRTRTESTKGGPLQKGGVASGTEFLFYNKRMRKFQIRAYDLRS